MAAGIMKQGGMSLQGLILQLEEIIPYILCQHHSCFNTRTGGGGAKNALPSGFSRIAEKRRRAAPPIFSVPAEN